jgi:hypothetical protein
MVNPTRRTRILFDATRRHTAPRTFGRGLLRFKAWRLAKRGGDGAVYDVAATAHGDTCTCPDQTYRHEGRDETGCKHIQALRLMGLLDPAPAPAPTPAGELVNQPVARSDVHPDESPDLDPRRRLRPGGPGGPGRHRRVRPDPRRTDRTGLAGRDEAIWAARREKAA